MRVVVVHSGGLDSTVLLASLVAQGHEVLPFSVDYGQRHARELQAAEDVWRHFGVEGKRLDLSALSSIFDSSSLIEASGQAIPEGHYEADSMKSTVVPNRNMLLLAAAAAYAINSQANAVAYGAHAGDHAIYPDCRGSFVLAMTGALAVCDWEPILLLTPFLYMTKAQIVAQGAEVGAPFGLTWSCYNGREKHCGVCGTCVERRAAFRLAGVIDPTEYE